MLKNVDVGRYLPSGVLHRSGYDKSEAHGILVVCLFRLCKELQSFGTPIRKEKATYFAFSL